MSAADFAKFIANAYGTGGAYPFTKYKGQDINLAYDLSKGLQLRAGFKDKGLSYTWRVVGRRIRHLIEDNRYLTEDEKTGYLEYIHNEEIRTRRAAIGKDLLSLVRKYNEETENKETWVNTYELTFVLNAYEGREISFGSKSVRKSLDSVLDTITTFGGEKYLPAVDGIKNRLIIEDNAEKQEKKNWIYSAADLAEPKVTILWSESEELQDGQVMFKNLYFDTKISNVAGVSSTDAQKTADLYYKIKYLREINGEKCGVTFATGTPISNSMAEIYTIQRYLQPEELARHQMSSFDAWVSTFGVIETKLELLPEGSGYQMKRRFAKFHNIPELKYDYTLFYFNPDSNAGGQIVQCPFSNDQAQRMVGNKDYFDVLAENTQYLSDINTISFFDCIFDIAERMEKGQFIGTFIDDAFSYKDMVKTEEKDELPKTISEFAKTYGNSSSFSKENER